MMQEPPTFGRRLTPWLEALGIGRHAIDDVLSAFNPLWALNRDRARVVDRVAETSAALTLVLQWPRAWPAPVPGQFLRVSVNLDGVNHQRAYSLRSVQGSPGHVAITVQRQPRGRVSGHLHTRVRVGDVLDVQPPAGDFVLPTPLPAQLLMLAGGSGITPFMAMLEHLRHTRAATRVTLVYFARSASERIFGKALAELAHQWPSLRLVNLDTHAHVKGAAGPAGEVVLSPALLDEHAPGWSHHATFCCGPEPLMDAARQIWRERGMSSRLSLEAFAPRRLAPSPGVVHRVRLVRAARHLAFTAPGDRNLLLAGEQAGVTLPHGCRQGICHECTCRLQSGSILDLRTGERRDGHGDLVQLCVSAPLSDLSLESMN